MGGIRDMFGGPSLGRLLQLAQRKMAAEDFDQARKLVEKGLALYPDAEPLRELDLSLRRAQAREGIQSLKIRIEWEGDPRAYEQLVSLYLELGLFSEARQEASAYAAAHPERDAAHLLLGEMSLQAFFEDLRASDAHAAHRRLERAATLNPQAVKPRLLLAELYYCVGADTQLRRVVEELEGIGQGDPALEELIGKLEPSRDGETATSLDGLFERIDVQGMLEREPTTWPLGTRRTRVNRLDENRAQQAAEETVAEGLAAELVLVQRGGTLVARATGRGEGGGGLLEQTEDGLVDVTRTVARTVARHAREFDLGGFKRCTIQGPFGLVTVGEVGGVMAGARWRGGQEPQRLWERVTLHLEGAVGSR